MSKDFEDTVTDAIANVIFANKYAIPVFPFFSQHSVGLLPADYYMSGKLFPWVGSIMTSVCKHHHPLPIVG